MDMKVTESKFRDGSASISLDELAADWEGWGDGEKLDFCHAVTEATFDYLPDVYRFIMKNGDIECWGAIAAWIPRKLPEAEALEWLVEVVHEIPTGKGEKFFQAMALTKSSEAKKALRTCLQRIWDDPSLLSEDNFFDNAAQDAVSCMEAMLQLGDEAPDLNQKYQILAQHPININRQTAIHKLGKYFS